MPPSSFAAQHLPSMCVDRQLMQRFLSICKTSNFPNALDREFRIIMGLKKHKHARMVLKIRTNHLMSTIQHTKPFFPTNSDICSRSAYAHENYEKQVVKNHQFVLEKWNTNFRTAWEVTLACNKSEGERPAPFALNRMGQASELIY